MNKKIERFAEMCARSRYEGLTQEEHLEKISLANELVQDGLMIHDGSYNFINNEDSEYFLNTIKNFLKINDREKYGRI